MKKGSASPCVVILSLLAAAIPVSIFASSFFMLALGIYWILEGVSFQRVATQPAACSTYLHRIGDSLKIKLTRFYANKAAVGFSSLYLLYLVGSFWSSNFHFTFQELHEKLPVLIFPMVFTGIKPLTEKELRIVLSGFIAGVLLGTLIGIYVLISTPFNDVRELSPFMPHIRFSLNICFAIFVLFHFLKEWTVISTMRRLSYLFLIIWMSLFLFILKSQTGILIFAGFLLYALGYLAMRFQHRWLRIGAAIVLVAIPLFASLAVYTIYDHHFHPNSPNIALLDPKTALGNAYVHDTVHFKVENGQNAGLYLCEKELKSVWEKRSKLNYNGPNKQGDELRYTIIRYLNSKGLRKDSAGLSQLSQKEIGDIENGVANAGLIRPFNLSSRLEGLLIDWEVYRKTGDANGKSELQKLEYWKATLSLLRQHWLTGVGTGDVEDAFVREYDQSHSKLQIRFRGTSHNQYLYMGVAFGIGGILIFLFWLVYPAWASGGFNDYYFRSLFFIVTLSMLTEDTIRHQVGLNFYVIFATLFLFGWTRPQKESLR